MQKTKLTLLAVVLCLCSACLWSQSATEVQVMRNVTLRLGPSTAEKSLGLLPRRRKGWS